MPTKDASTYPQSADEVFAQRVEIVYNGWAMQVVPELADDYTVVVTDEFDSDGKPIWDNASIPEWPDALVEAAIALAEAADKVGQQDFAATR